MHKTYRLIIPETVEAVKLSPSNLQYAATWAKGVPVSLFDPSGHFGPVRTVVALDIPTLHGLKRAMEGQYVVKKMSGDLRIVDALDFEGKYELIKP